MDKDCEVLVAHNRMKPPTCTLHLHFLTQSVKHKTSVGVDIDVWENKRCMQIKKNIIRFPHTSEFGATASFVFAFGLALWSVAHALQVSLFVTFGIHSDAGWLAALHLTSS